MSVGQAGSNYILTTGVSVFKAYPALVFEVWLSAIHPVGRVLDRTYPDVLIWESSRLIALKINAVR